MKAHISITSAQLAGVSNMALGLVKDMSVKRLSIIFRDALMISKLVPRMIAAKITSMFWRVS
jgi:hypothetical protein